MDDNTKDLLIYNFGLTNEDKHLNATQLIRKYGYPVEEHEVVTEDGYVLKLIRIPGSGPPVLLMHGIVCSADEFLTSAPGGALAYLLADRHYDVWMGNARGNKYSMRHIKLSSRDKRFWNFSFHEIGMYDLPAKIDFILATTGTQNLYYVGHSQGTTSCYVMLSLKPEYNDKLIVMVSLAPMAWVNHLYSPVIRALVPIQDVYFSLMNRLGKYYFFSDNFLINAIKSIFCGNSYLGSLLCDSFVTPVLGFDYIQLNFTNFPVQIAHVPSGSSNKQLQHYVQEIPDTEQFQQFDYGNVWNLEMYGSLRPPPYPVSQISARVALFYSDGDWLSSADDVDRLADELNNLVFYYKVPYNHMDYLWAKNAKELVYSKIFDLFQIYQD